MMKNRTIIPSVFVIYIIIWTIISAIFLSIFPFMHSDEAWLAGLSRTILAERNPAATESFFNIMPRAPHAIKLLYHFLQIVFIKIFGYGLFSLRLLSLTAGAASLYAFGKLLKRLSLSPLAGAVLLSLEIQFIYASRFGRQEIFILLFMLISLNCLYSEKHKAFIRGFLAGLPIAAAVGFHPNAFIAAWPAGLLLLIFIIRKKRGISEGLGFILSAAAGAAVFAGLSLAFNSSFAADYGSFGSEVGALDPLNVKLLGLDDFYHKLFLRVSGTYYTPNLIPLFAISGAALVFTVIKAASGRRLTPALLTALAGIAGVNAGIVLIGKYSAPSIVFLIPFLIILICLGIKDADRAPRLLYAAAAVVLLTNSALMVREELGADRETYTEYIGKIETAIPQDAMTIGGLTAGFYFDEGKLLDWRNLSYLDKAGMSIREYIERSGIEYIIYTDEIDYIYNSRPVWNILYGNPVIYYKQLQDFLSERCELITNFDSPSYGTRLTHQRYKKDWEVRIYRVKYADF